MNAQSIIVILIVIAIIFFAIRYIIKEKKKGNDCIGCPYCNSCPKNKRNKTKN